MLVIKQSQATIWRTLPCFVSNNAGENAIAISRHNPQCPDGKALSNVSEE
jgi:hypothetical protein